MFNFTQSKRAGTPSGPETPLPTGNMAADQTMSPQSTWTTGPRQSQASTSRQNDGRQTVGIRESNNEGQSYTQSSSWLQTTPNTYGDNSSDRLLEQEESILWGGSHYGTGGGSRLTANLTETVDTSRSTKFTGRDDSSGIMTGGAYGPNANEIQGPDNNAEREVWDHDGLEYSFPCFRPNFKPSLLTAALFASRSSLRSTFAVGDSDVPTLTHSSRSSL